MLVNGKFVRHPDTDGGGGGDPGGAKPPTVFDPAKHVDKTDFDKLKTEFEAFKASVAKEKTDAETRKQQEQGEFAKLYETEKAARATDVTKLTDELKRAKEDFIIAYARRDMKEIGIKKPEYGNNLYAQLKEKIGDYINADGVDIEKITTAVKQYKQDNIDLFDATKTPQAKPDKKTADDGRRKDDTGDGGRNVNSDLAAQRSAFEEAWLGDEN